MKYAIAFVLALFTVIGAVVINADQANAEPISYDQAEANYSRHQALNLDACWTYENTGGVHTNRCTLY